MLHSAPDGGLCSSCARGPPPQVLQRMSKLFTNPLVLIPQVDALINAQKAARYSKVIPTKLPPGYPGTQGPKIFTRR